MLRKLILLVVFALSGGGGWYFFQHYRLEGLNGIRVVPAGSGVEDTREFPWVPSFSVSADGDQQEVETVPVYQRNTPTIKIASFNIQVFGNTKASKTRVMDLLARIVRRFDVVAIQEIRCRDQDLLPRFVELINETDRYYDYVIGPRQGRTDSKEQYAFIFDRQSVEVDRMQVYSIEDPDDLLHRPPLVALFRVRGPPAEQAFTFTLTNLHTDPDETGRELATLGEMFRLIRADGRQEDDVILLGDFNADDTELAHVVADQGLRSVVLNKPTNTRGTAQYDNLLIHDGATVEFTGRGGVFDFMREFNLPREVALEVSDHLPVWAEFSVFEGGTSGAVASR